MRALIEREAKVLAAVQSVEDHAAVARLEAHHVEDLMDAVDARQALEDARLVHDEDPRLVVDEMTAVTVADHLPVQDQEADQDKILYSIILCFFLCNVYINIQ